MSKATTVFTLTTLILIGILTHLCAAAWESYPVEAQESIVPENILKGRHGEPSFLVAPGGSILFLADLGVRAMRILHADQSVMEYSDLDPKGAKLMRTERAREDEGMRRDMFGEEPVLETLTNAVVRQGEVITMHSMNYGYVRVRIFQYLDSKLKVTRTWEHRLPLLAKSRKREPLAINSADHVAAWCEPGEVRLYLPEGEVQKRLVVPGKFNSSRAVKLELLSAEEHGYMKPGNLEMVNKMQQYDSERQTTAIKEMEAALPDPVELQGDLMPTDIVEIAFEGKEKLLLLDGESRIFRIDILSAKISILDIENFKLGNYGGALEKVYQMRLKGDDMFLLTKFRVLHVKISTLPKLVGEITAPPNKTGANTAWDVNIMAPEKGEGYVAMSLFLDKHNRNIERVKIAPSK